MPLYVKVVTCIDEHTENYHLVLQSPQLYSVLAPPGLLFWFYGPKRNLYGSLSPLSLGCRQPQPALFSKKKL